MALAAIAGLRAGPAGASIPPPPGLEADLCPETRSAAEDCVFGFGPERRLRVPWSVFTDPRWGQQDDPRISTYGQRYRIATWPRGYCRPWDACAPEVGASGRREALLGRHPFIFESWTLRGALLPDGQVLHVAAAAPSEEAADRTAGRVRFSLLVSTRAEQFETRGATAPTSTLIVRGRPVALWRDCRPRLPDGTSCLLTGNNHGVYFRIAWIDRDDIGSEAMFAAAANLFDRYVIEGERIGP
ncbi:hypothetical protein [Neoroseomonas soli]|uniref:Uncharacterized protein n=1 Tax=Neoroseomonas soli TaxID=1081025 RepID=A0A9X9X309_9PROT|nr:hypothetical protein [Neoroseomonas soli]MBR0673788.1 hypothetical protein [Neoroseomonas soli]